MRNLKRALSMAMASVMLMGMSVVGTGAANVSDFSDVDSINNLEAVSIATGLGIFDGYDDGEFKPEKVVTRAEMAVVIAKILHGADVNPSNLVGAGKFTDVPAWAEGYVNLVSALGIIEGYGDGKFGPNDPVTTVQANIMLLKALGYYTHEGDNLPANWADAQLEATSKATALGIVNNEMELPMNAGLTREDVAELTFNALFAQRVGFDDDRGLHVKANDRNVIVTNGTNDEMNTLAQNTFGLYAVEGIVIGNGMTNESLSEDVKSAAQTRVMFEENVDLDKDGKVEYAEGEYYDFEVESGLDMIGHATKVYYKIEKKAPVVYAMIDQATLVAKVDYAQNTTTFANRANAAGFKKNTILDIGEANYILNYDWNTKVDISATGNLIVPGNTLDNLLVISNSANKEVDYVIALDQYLDTVDSYDEDKEEYVLDHTNLDMNVATADFVEDDFVIVTKIGNGTEVLVAEPAILAEGDLTKIIGKTAGTASVTKIVVDGEEFVQSDVNNNFAGISTKVFTEFNDIQTIDKVTLVMDQWGEVMGLAKEAAIPNYAYVAQFGLKHSTGSLSTKDVLNVHVYFADGTNGIYEVDTVKSTVDWKNVLKDADVKDLNGTSDATNVQDWLAVNTATVDHDNNGTDDKVVTAKGLYNVKVLANGKVAIDPLTTNAPEAATTNYVLNKGLSTLLKSANGSGDTNYVDTTAIPGSTNTLLNSNDTIYFYVTGNYNDKNLNVKVITGIKNAISFVNKAGDDTTIADVTTTGSGIRQTFVTKVKGGLAHTDRAEINTMLIQGVVVEGTDVYYYNRDYYVTETENGFVVTYTIWDNKTGEAYEVTYDNSGKYYATEQDAKDAADYTEVGFYTVGATELKDEFLKSTEISGTAGDGFGWNSTNKTYYLINDEAKYDDWNDNLLSAHNKVGSITENTTIVDLTGNGMNSIAKIANAIKVAKDGTHNELKLSYSYNDKYETSILFVSEFKPKKTDAPGTPDSGDYTMTSMNVTKDGVLGIVLSDEHKNNEKFTLTLYTWSQEQAKWAVQSTKTFTDTNGSDKIIGDGVMGFAMTNGVTYKIAVNGVEFNEFIFDNTAGNPGITPVK